MLFRSVYGIASGNGGDESGIALDCFADSDTFNVIGSFLPGSRFDPVSDHRQIQGHYALIFRIYDSVDVLNAGYLSHVDASGLVKTDRTAESDYQYFDHVPRCDAE